MLQDYAAFHAQNLAAAPPVTPATPATPRYSLAHVTFGEAEADTAYVPRRKQLAAMSASPAVAANAVSPTFRLRRKKGYFDGLGDAAPDPAYPDRSTEEEHETRRQEIAWERQQLLGPVLYLLAADQSPQQRAEIRAREKRWEKAVRTAPVKRHLQQLQQGNLSQGYLPVQGARPNTAMA